MSGNPSALRNSPGTGGDVPPRRDRRAERRAATRDEILVAAWELVRERGIAELSLRDLGDRVGMRAQSLYSYFPSKDAIYDAMFRDANLELLRRMEALDHGGTAEQRLRARTRVFVEFAVEEAARSNLLFQRVVPGFVPSPEAYAPAVRVLDLTHEALAAVGATEPAALDLWTAIISGLISQQISNDPGGDRWLRLLDDAIDMFLQYTDHTPSRRAERAGGGKTR
jgi:AcrR family transcriptional regulator